MQQVQSIQKLSEIDQLSKSDLSIMATCTRVLNQFNLSGINKQLKGIKRKGVPCCDIFRMLFMLPFLNLKNVHSLFNSGIRNEVAGEKDVYYRFLNNPNIPWRSILMSFMKQVQRVIIKNTHDDEADSGARCLIVDDSLLPKSGKKTELIGKVRDHVSGKYLLGIKLLLVGLWDGKSFMPINFSLHHEPGKTRKRGLTKQELHAQFTKQRNEGSASTERIEELGCSKLQIAMSMIKQVVLKGIRFDYVLADSWFVSEGFIRFVVGIKQKANKLTHLIGLMRSNRFVEIGKRKYKLNKIPEVKRKQIKYSKKLKCYYIPLQVKYKGIDLKIFLIRMKGQNTWKVLVCSNLKLTFIQAMKIYQTRWTIEVFFRDAKQNLHLGKCQSVDFDAQIASISIACMNYMALALAKRFMSYETIGKLFKALKDDIILDTVFHKIWSLMVDIYSVMLAPLGVVWENFIRKAANSCDIFNRLKDICKVMINFNETEYQFAS